MPKEFTANHLHLYCKVRTSTNHKQQTFCSDVKFIDHWSIRKLIYLYMIDYNGISTSSDQSQTFLFSDLFSIYICKKFKFV